MNRPIDKTTMAATPESCSSHQIEMEQKAVTGTTPPLTNDLTNKGSKVKFTEFTSDSRLTKAVNLVNGEVVKDGGTNMYHGNAKQIEIEFSEVPEYLLILTEKQAICSGVFDREKVEITIPNNPIPGAKRRCLDDMSWPEGPGIVLIDHDATGGDALSMEEVLQAIEEIIPEINSTAVIQRPSTGSCIYGEDGEELIGVRGHHTLLYVADMENLDKLKEILEHRLWLGGRGVTFVSLNGSCYARNSILDMAVFSRERLIYEADAVCGEGLRQDRGQHIYIDGNALNISRLAPPTEDERGLVKKLKALSKAKAKPEVEEKEREYLKTEVPKVIERKKCTQKAAEKIVKSRKYGTLLGSDVVYLLVKGGEVEVEVSELLLHPEKYDPDGKGALMLDPVEPDYCGRKQCAVFFANVNGSPKIKTQAHQGCTYSLNFDYSSLFEAIDKATNEGSKESVEFVSENWPRFMEQSELTDTEGDRICNAVKLATGIKKKAIEDEYKKIVKERRRRGMRDVSDEDREKVVSLIDMNHSAMAAFVASRLKDSVVILPGRGAAYDYAGEGLWSQKSGKFLHKKILDLFNEIIGDQADYTSQYLNGVADLARLALTISPEKEEELLGSAERGKFVPFYNGVYNVERGELEPHSRYKFFRTRLPYDWEPSPPSTCPLTAGTYLDIVEDAPNFYRLTNQMLGRHGVEVLCACIKATITGQAKLQFYVEMYGDAESGRGTLISVLEALIGAENIANTTLEQLEENKFEIRAMLDSLMILISEAPEFTRKINTFKAIVGNDPIRDEGKGVQQTGKGVKIDGIIWMSMNKPLRTPETSRAMIRRKVALNCVKRWTKRDVDLREKIITRELPHIFNAVMSMPDADVQRLVHLPVHECPMKRDNFLKTNPVGRFLEEQLIKEEGGSIAFGGYKPEMKLKSLDTTFDSKDTLFGRYRKWHYSNFESPGSALNMFSEYVKLGLQCLYPAGDVSCSKDRANKVRVNGAKLA